MQRQKQEPNGNYFICDIILISDNYIFFSSFSSIYFVCLFALLTLVAGSLLNHANIINDFTFVFFRFTNHFLYNFRCSSWIFLAFILFGLKRTSFGEKKTRKI